MKKNYNHRVWMLLRIQKIISGKKQYFYFKIKKSRPVNFQKPPGLYQMYDIKNKSKDAMKTNAGTDLKK